MEDEDILRELMDPLEARTAWFEEVTAGMSGSRVLRITQPDAPARYAKIAEGDGVLLLRDEAARTKWLAAQGIRVPRIESISERDGRAILLMDAMPGVAAIKAALPSSQIAVLLGKAFASLHAIAAASCPFDESLAVRLARAAKAVAAGEVDAAHFDARNIGTPPEQLLERLATQRPTAEDLVVIHGDATLENLTIDTGGGIGFIDCAAAGSGDRYIDLALLAADIDDQFGHDARAAFIAAYGAGDWRDDKAAFFLDLYELF